MTRHGAYLPKRTAWGDPQYRTLAVAWCYTCAGEHAWLAGCPKVREEEHEAMLARREAQRARRET